MSAHLKRCSRIIICVILLIYFTFVYCNNTNVELEENSTNVFTTLTPQDSFESNQSETYCVPPAIEQFPRPIIGAEARRHGALIIHFMVAIYTFLGLAIVCDEYFVASLDRLCHEMKISPDVAGATFMAAGSSAPELSTVVIGVFLAKDDIGISGVIGSAVFNIMFVISMCSLFATKPIYLNWWPLLRDTFFYALSILLMLITIYNEQISWIEALVMLVLYCIYCTALHFNTLLESWAYTLPISNFFLNKSSAKEANMTYNDLTLTEDETKHINSSENDPGVNNGEVPVEKTIDPEWNPLLKPMDGTLYEKIRWYLVLPIYYTAQKTIPNCRAEIHKNLYLLTFFISMIWIAFYSYIMVWMITIIGSTCGIPDTVMGLTFVAAGVSVPDALSSVAVIKEGHGDMAISNAIGSNVFDILICLGLPWFVRTAITRPGTQVKVISKGLTYSTLSLLSTVFFLIVTIHLNGWKLDKRIGTILLICYVCFITFASLYEMNVFGYLNPMECTSKY